MGFKVRQISKSKFPAKEDNKQYNISLSFKVTSLYHLTH